MDERGRIIGRLTVETIMDFVREQNEAHGIGQTRFIRPRRFIRPYLAGCPKPAGYGWRLI